MEPLSCLMMSRPVGRHWRERPHGDSPQSPEPVSTGVKGQVGSHIAQLTAHLFPVHRSDDDVWKCVHRTFNPKLTPLKVNVCPS